MNKTRSRSIPTGLPISKKDRPEGTSNRNGDEGHQGVSEKPGNRHQGSACHGQPNSREDLQVIIPSIRGKKGDQKEVPNQLLPEHEGTNIKILRGENTTAVPEVPEV